MTHILVFSVYDYNREEVEKYNGGTFTRDKINQLLSDDIEADLYQLVNFAIATNDQIIDIENSWLAVISIIEPNSLTN